MSGRGGQRAECTGQRQGSCQLQEQLHTSHTPTSHQPLSKRTPATVQAHTSHMPGTHQPHINYTPATLQVHTSLSLHTREGRSHALSPA